MISEEHPFLGASPDAAVYDPSHIEPFGLAEVKCPYSCRQITPVEACSRPNFCCTVSMNGNVPGLKLRKEHLYYSQVQGQMGVTKRKWCDFIVYTEKGLSVERIKFDSDFWEKELVPSCSGHIRPSILMCPYLRVADNNGLFQSGSWKVSFHHHMRMTTTVVK